MEAHPSQIRRCLKPALSLLLIYHLFCAIMVPHSENYIGVKVAPIIGPYVYFFELTNAWSFFAPDPGGPIFIEYELLDAKGQSFKRGRWPEMEASFFLRERQNRRISATDFMMAAEMRTEKMMVPFLCSRELKTHSLRLWRVANTLPTMAEVESGKRKLGDEVGIDKKFVSHNFCDSAPSTLKREAASGNG